MKAGADQHHAARTSRFSILDSATCELLAVGLCLAVTIVGALLPAYRRRL